METELCSAAPDDWDIKPLEAVCSRITSGGTPSRREPGYYINGTWPWVKTQELQDKWIDSTEESITEQAIANSSAKVLPANTVLVAMYGATVGQLGLLRRPMTCNQACCALLVEPTIADYRFVFYQLLHARSELKRLATGAAQQNLSGVVIRGLRFPYPSVTEQRAIADVLSALDDKIELNRRMNETLETMTLALFQSWFIDTEHGTPERADWRTGRLDEIAHVTMGLSPPGETYNSTGEGAPLVNGPVEFGDYFAKAVKWTTAPTRICEPGDLILCVRGSTTGRRVIADSRFCLGRGVCSIRATTRSRAFVQSAITLGLPRLLAMTSGSVFPSLSSPDIKAFPVIIPSDDVGSAFDALATDWLERRELNARNAETLAAARDVLLPRLISGELRVREAERLVGKVA